MLNAVFPVFNAIDALIAIIPLVFRIGLWGAASGIAAIGIYGILSNQTIISALKAETRHLRKQMLDFSLDNATFSSLGRRNLIVSLKLLGRVIGPALLSALPVLTTAEWLNTFHGHKIEDNRAVPFFVYPNDAGIKIHPAERLRHEAEGGLSIVPAIAEDISVSVYDQLVYTGNPFSPPVPYVTKKKWWNFLFAGEAGYLNPDAPIHEIRLGLKKKSLIKGMPPWASGWELPFFISVFVAALSIKLGFRIQ